MSYSRQIRWYFLRVIRSKVRVILKMQNGSLDEAQWTISEKLAVLKCSKVRSFV